MNSIALKFDLYTGGTHNPTTGLFTDGQFPESAPANNVSLNPINLGSGDPLQITLNYDGATLDELVVDTVTSATFTHSYSVNIPEIVGGPTAFVGFTGGTGGFTAIQDVLDWQFQSQAGVPEPSTLTLLCLGVLGLVVYAWRQRLLRDQVEKKGVSRPLGHDREVFFRHRAC